MLCSQSMCNLMSRELLAYKIISKKIYEMKFVAYFQFSAIKTYTKYS